MVANVVGRWVALASVAVGGASCGAEASQDAGAKAACVGICADLASCGLVSDAEAAACGRRCAVDPTVTSRDDGSVDPDCADPDDPCDCLDHTSLHFERGLALTAFPASRGSDGALVRQCGTGPIDGLLIDAVLEGRGRWRWQDIAGIPSDRLVGFEPVSADLSAALRLALGCLEGAADTGPSCAGTAPTATAGPPTYLAGAPRGKRQVVVIVDQSGSTAGLVDPAREHHEARVGTFDVPDDFHALGSDPVGARIAMAEYVARRLAPTDELCVLGAGQDRLTVPNVAGAGDATDAILASCFDGGDHARWLYGAGVGQLQSGAGGRAKLWSAIDVAWDLLAARSAPGIAPHILVLNDGPDTCGGEALTSCEPACAGDTVGVDQIRARLAGDTTLARVDFIQLQALGYPDRDPRQLAVACQSGGQYVFLDHEAGMSEAAVTTLLAQLNDAVAAITASWDGVWRFSVEAPAVTSGGEAPSGTPPGALYALRGELIVGPGSALVAAEARFPFGIVPVGGDAPTAASWDRRLVFRKACGGGADCGGEPADSCLVTCSAETRLCAADPAGDPLPNGASCGTGTCCDRMCSAAESCCTTPGS